MSSSKRPLLATALFAFVVLAGTADERVFGLFTDGQIMTRTAFSIVETSGLGIARGHAVDVPRPQGDAVTRYGLGPSLALALPSVLAGPMERTFGVGTSQTLFVLLQVILVLLAALSSASLARSWGGGDAGARRALLSTALASPLWAYASSDFSEPLQASLIGGAFAFAARAAQEPREARSRLTRDLDALAAGLLTGFALVTKSIFVVLLPFVALAAWGGAGGRLRRLGFLLGGFLPMAASWLALEVVRFGRPFASYEGERFSHSLPDGLWRLLVGPNKGLLLYFPLVLLSVLGLRLLLARDRLQGGATAAFCAFLLVSSSAWWAWDGTAGWGPRLLLPMVPLLSALAAVASLPVVPDGPPRPASARGLAFAVLFVAGLAVNALGVFQPDAVTTWYFTIVGPKPLTEAQANQYPSFAWQRDAEGRPALHSIHWVHGESAYSPIRTAWFLLRNRLGSGDRSAALAAPPWPIPDQKTPYLSGVPGSALVFLTTPFRWPHLGMSLYRKPEQVDTALAYVDSVFDQALRAQDVADGEQAVAWAERLYRMMPSAQTAPLLAEAYRLAGRKADLERFWNGLPREQRVAPEMGIVLALQLRDLGNDQAAVTVLDSVLQVAPRPDFARLAGVPPQSWPRTMRDITAPRKVEAARVPAPPTQ